MSAGTPRAPVGALSASERHELRQLLTRAGLVSVEVQDALIETRKPEDVEMAV
jgi:hypothetical protein